LPTHLCLGLPSCFVPSGFSTKILHTFLFYTFVLHSMPIPSSFSWSFYLYLEKRISYEAPH
jgi:hypothetical protein